MAKSQYDVTKVFLAVPLQRRRVRYNGILAIKDDNKAKKETRHKISIQKSCMTKAQMEWTQTLD